MVDVLERMPLLFVPEQVSPEGAMGFAVRGRYTSIWVSETGITYRLSRTTAADTSDDPGSWIVALDLVGATPRRPLGEDPLPTKVSYFKGPKDQWRTGLPSYGSVRYREPWPGVDVVVSGTAGELESIFVVQPGADPDQIRLAYRGATSVQVEMDGSLVVDTPLGEIREQAPFAYQEIDGRRLEVAAAFALEEAQEPGRHAYRFRLGDYDPDRELIIDPLTLIYCGYIGGAVDELAYDIAVDAAGNAYVTGWTCSNESTFPVSVGPDSSYHGGVGDAFVAKVSASGTALVYCGYIGGSESDWGRGIAIDSAGSAYVTGQTNSGQDSFPVTVGPDLSHNGYHDAFVAKVNASGTSLDYCGYIGGSGFHESGYDIAVDTQGRAYVAGWSDSDQSTFPVTTGPDLTLNGYIDAFVAKVSPAGDALDYCGYIGGDQLDQGLGIAVDAAGCAYVTGFTFSGESTFPVALGPDLTFNGGRDAFVTRVNATGTALTYCGYIGGWGEDYGNGIAAGDDGSAWVAGQTYSDETSFPVMVGPDLTFNGVFDAFVAKVGPTGATLAYSGYIGGSGGDGATAIALDGSGNAYVTGWTSSSDLPVKIGPDLTYNHGEFDSFVALIDRTGTGLHYCGYIGGIGDFEVGHGIDVDASGHAYVAGVTDSNESSFPVMGGPDITYNGGTDVGDAYVAKVSAFFVFVDGFESGATSAWSATVP